MATQENRTMMTPEEPDPYAVLGLSRGASLRDVKVQFRRLAKRFHPDLHAGDSWHQEQFRRIHAAYERIDGSYRVSAPAPLDGEAAPAASEARTPPTDGYWTSIGAATRSGSPPFKPETISPRRRRRLMGCHIGRTLKAGAITWGLAAVALVLVGIVLTGSHGGGVFASSGLVREAPKPSSASGALPPVVLLPNEDRLAGPAASPADADRSVPAPPAVGEGPIAAGPVQSSAFGSSAPAADPPSAAAPAQFSVDAKYTQIDPAYTAVDPHYTTVDVQTPGAGPQEIGVDSRSTGIDPKLIRP